MQARTIFSGRALGLALVLAVMGVWLWIEATPTPRVAPAPERSIVIDKSPRAESERKVVIDKLIADGLVRRIDTGRAGILRVSLGSAFYSLDDTKRREYADVIFRQYFDGSSVNDVISLRDARNGNEVGRYNPYQGGLNMYR